MFTGGTSVGGNSVGSHEGTWLNLQNGILITS